MPVPQRRQSHSRSRKRKSHDFLTAKASTTCKNCGEPVLSHHVCRACGFYRGVQVLGTSEDVVVDEAE